MANTSFAVKAIPKTGEMGLECVSTKAKIGDRIDGYYGYPHSEHFICIRGKVDSNLITGEALEISWAINPSNKILPTPTYSNYKCLTGRDLKYNKFYKSKGWAMPTLLNATEFAKIIVFNMTEY